MYKCNYDTIELYGSTHCSSCNYDYSFETGMLTDKPIENTYYIGAFKKFQIQPCKDCNAKFAERLDIVTNYYEDVSEEEYRKYRKYD